MDYDPTLYAGTASHYLVGRPPYSRQLADVLARELGLDGSGVLLDVGSGPGPVAVELAELFDSVLAIDPDPAMVHAARRHAEGRGRTNVECVVARAEDIGSMDLPPMRVVTFGQSFHWTDQLPVVEMVYDRLVPGGSVVMLTHDIDSRPERPAGTGDPPIPHDEILEIVHAYLGSERRAGASVFRESLTYQDALERSRFRTWRVVYAPGREDITRDVDGVISGYLSMSWAAPHLFGDRLGAFVAEVRALLDSRTPTGRFWDWPGDTWLLIATKPAP